MIPRWMIPQQRSYPNVVISSFLQLQRSHTIHCSRPSFKTQIMVLTTEDLHQLQQSQRRSFSTTSSSTDANTSRLTIKDDNRIPPIIETNPSLLKAIIDPINRLHGTIQHFKNGLTRLINDYYTSRYIHDATMTRLSLIQRNNIILLPNKNQIYPNRRAQEHLRQFSRDIAITLPTVAAFVLLPVVGNAALFLGMAFPRYLLSRQFHTMEQRREFAMEEYGFRRVWFVSLIQNDDETTTNNGSSLLSSSGLCKNIQNRMMKIDDQQQIIPMMLLDVAGPIYSKSSMQLLYNCIHDTKLSINTLSRNHLVNLALANNLSSSLLLPSSIAPSFVKTCIPSIYLVRKLTTLAEDIIMDDIAMIDEGYHNCYYHNHDDDGDIYYCVGMTDIEVFEACYIRGLPVGRFATAYDGIKGNNSKEGEALATRKLLAHYLQMMDMIMNQTKSDDDDDGKVVSSSSSGVSFSKGELVRDSALQLLVLHIHAIRFNYLIQKRKEK